MGRSMRVAMAVFAVISAAAAPLAGGCRTATQVTLELRTTGVLRCADLKGIDIVVADTPGAADARIDTRNLSASVERGRCDDVSRVGSLVLTPSSGRGAVVVIARVDEGAKCTRADAFKGCIVARRSFAFIEHAGLTMPVTLEASCKDVPCDAITSCRAGTCRDASADCSEDTGTCLSPAEPSAPVGPGDDGGGAGEGGSDAPAGDAPFDTSMQDAPIDAKDSGTDGAVGTPGLPTNYCWTSDIPTEFDSSTQLCCCPAQVCNIQTFPATCINNQFNCSGKKGCGSLYCCGIDPITFEHGGSCMSSCPITLCGHDDDCPPGEVCGAEYYRNMAGAFKKCVPKP